MKILVFLFCTASLCAQESTFQKGKIIDSIPVSNRTTESYALYLPEEYDPSLLSPAVFIFDPVARGKNGIDPFIKASEKYGYILVCSNNSRNGPYQQNLEIASRLFDEIFAEFLIDEKRIYTAGFSGGARLASTIAVLSEQIQGVVACGAGFSANKGHQPFDEKFSYAVVIGDEDMNLGEMYKTKDWLNKLNISNELFIFDIDHRWPARNQILTAFDWLQLEAIKKGFVPKNDEDLMLVYRKNYIRAQELEKQNRLNLAADEYERILRNFQRHFQVDSVSKRLSLLKKNKLYKRERKSIESTLVKEAALVQQFYEKFRTDLGNTSEKSETWQAEIVKLNKKIDTTKPHENKMLKRVLYSIYAMAIETISNPAEKFTMNQKILCYDICVYSQPRYPYSYLMQIANYLTMDKVAKARVYLEQLLNLGYDIEFIRNHRILEGFRDSDEFKSMIKT